MERERETERRAGWRFFLHGIHLEKLMKDL